MFVLDPEQVRNKVFFYQEHKKVEDKDTLVPYVLVRENYGWHRYDVNELQLDRYNNKLIHMKSKKSEKEYFWYLKDVIYVQLNGAVPEGYAVRQLDADVYTPHNFVLRKLNTRFGHEETAVA